MADPAPAATDSQKPDSATPTSTPAPEGKSLLGAQPDAPEGKPATTPTSGDQKAPSGQPAAKEGEAKKDEKPADKSEEKITIKLPEGMQADPKQVEEFSAIAKELGLKSEGAQKVIDLFVKNQQAQAQQLVEQQKQWEKEITSQPGYEKQLGLAKKALAKLADEDTRILLNSTWMGSHPGLIRMLAKAGELIAEDKLLESGTGKGEFSAADFYPTMKKK